MQDHHIFLFKFKKAHFHQPKFINLSIQILILFLFKNFYRYLFGLNYPSIELSLVQYFLIKSDYHYTLFLIILLSQAIQVI